MSVFDKHRLTQALLKLDVEGLRKGVYTDKYFVNVATVLSRAAALGKGYDGEHARPHDFPVKDTDVGNIDVEAQYFTRHAPSVVVAGIDAALAILRYASGSYQAGDGFAEAWERLDVEAVHDGSLIPYDGQPENALPVIKVRGRYRDFAILETPMLGVLAHATRIATNVYETLQVTNGKPVLFFPARFDLYQTQAVDGYAYWLAVERYNRDFGQQTKPLVSTDAQAAWWGGLAGGTAPHALIAAYLGDTAAAMVAFAEHLPVENLRTALVDFENDVVNTSLQVLDAYWPRYRAAYEAGDLTNMRRWTLDGVRLDTSANMVDVSLPTGSPGGVSPVLVRTVRAALDAAWQRWEVPERLREESKSYCRRVKIVVTGGFNRERIAQFEADGVPVDTYGVGTTFLHNDRETNTDFTMDIVRVKLNGSWVDLAKKGRRAVVNPNLQPVDLSLL